jgi:hypothetical protein
LSRYSAAAGSGPSCRASLALPWGRSCQDRPARPNFGKPEKMKKIVAPALALG